MKAISGIVTVLVVIVILAFLTGAIYIVDETQQVVITQFGRPVGEAVTRAGLHIKMPIVQMANYFDKRLLQWDGDPNQILANNSVRNNSTFTIATLRIGAKTIEDVKFTVLHRQNNPIVLGSDVMRRIGRYTVDEEAREIIFEYRED